MPDYEKYPFTIDLFRSLPMNLGSAVQGLTSPETSNLAYYDAIYAARKRIKAGNPKPGDYSLASRLIPEYTRTIKFGNSFRDFTIPGELEETWYQTLGESLWESLKFWESPEERLRQEQDERIRKWRDLTGITTGKQPEGILESLKFLESHEGRLRQEQEGRGSIFDQQLTAKTSESITLPNIPLVPGSIEVGGATPEDRLIDLLTWLPIGGGAAKALKGTPVMLAKNVAKEAERIIAENIANKLPKYKGLTRLQGRIYDIIQRNTVKGVLNEDKTMQDLFGLVKMSITSPTKQGAQMAAGVAAQAGAKKAGRSAIEEFLDRFKQISTSVAKKEKDPNVPMSPEDVALWEKDWKAYSRKRGYTEGEITEYEQYLDMVEQGKKMGIPEADLIAAEHVIPTTPPKTGQPVDLFIYRGESTVKPYYRLQEYGSGTYYYADISAETAGRARKAAQAYAAGKPNSNLDEKTLQELLRKLGGNVEEAFVHLKNPYVVGQEGDRLLKQVTSAAKTRATKLGLTGKEFDNYVAAAIPNTLKKRGHDGLVVIKGEGVLEVIPYGDISKASEAFLTPKVEVTLEGAVNKLSEVIRKELKPAQAKIREEYRKLDSVKLAKFYASLKQSDKLVESRQITAEEAMRRANAQLRGEMDRFETTLADKLTPAERDILYNELRVRDLPGYKKQQVKDALDALLYRNEIPHQKDLEALEDLFGIEFARAILSQRPYSERFWTEFFDILNAPRSVLASMDMSAPLRQGWVLAAGHPTEWARAWGWMFRAVTSEKNAVKLNDILFGRNLTDKALVAAAERRLNAGLFLHDLGSEVKLITFREEMYASRWIRKMASWEKYIPGWNVARFATSEGVKLSERTYVTFLNKLRADVFDSVVRNWERSGRAIKQVDLTELARFINRATGRGELTTGEYVYQGSKLMRSPYGGFANLILFSPRLQTSRILLPMSMIFNKSPAVRQLACKDLALMAGTTATLLTLASMAPGVSVELDPRSTDFGRIRVGNTRVDILGGFQPWVRLVAQVATGTVKKLEGSTVATNRLWNIWKFVRGKLNPTFGMVWDFLEGKTYLGEDTVDPWEAITDPAKRGAFFEQMFNDFTPMFIQDLVNAVQEEGLVGAAYAIPGFFGASVLSYDSSMYIASEVRSLYQDSRNMMKEYADLLGKDPQAAQKLAYDEPLIIYSELLGTAVSYINKIEKAIEELEKNDTISADDKKYALEEYRRMLIQYARDVINTIQGLPTSGSMQDGQQPQRISPLQNVGR